MRTMCSQEIFTKKCQHQQIFDSDLKGAWHYNHMTFTPIAKNFMLYCRLIYMLSILCVRLTIKVKVGIPESFKVGWYPQKKLGRVTLRFEIHVASDWRLSFIKQIFLFRTTRLIRLICSPCHSTSFLTKSKVYLSQVITPVFFHCISLLCSFRKYPYPHHTGNST